MCNTVSLQHVQWDVCDQDDPAEEGRGGEEGDPVPLHGVALPQQPLQQRPPGVQTESASGETAVISIFRLFWFLQVMNQHPETQDGPVIVHCK